ncbi:SDR family NAD(P)-dependent oxidoreductase [Microbacterium oleivorans]|nr:SDR family NAD(P)-dependent oxidoreductase [Microbacterium oleivorans]
MAERLAGKIALVTGGAAGMGAAHARGIVAEGGKVVIADLADEAGQQLADELGDSAIFVHMNVTIAADWDNAVKIAQDTFGGLNVLVNNAGPMGMGSIATYSEEDWDRVMAINVKGAFLGIKHSYEALKASQPASIINVSSVTGLQGVGGLAPYSTSKWALRGLTPAIDHQSFRHLPVPRVRPSCHPG